MEKDSRHHDEQPDDFSPPAVPVGVDGGPMVGYGTTGQPSPVPARHPDHFICLRGPCRHYWHLVTMAQEGNPEETWAHLGIEAPRQHHHTCLINPGFETSFGDDNAYECSRWDPTPKQELIQLRVRRDAYFKDHPEHAPTPEIEEEDETDDGN